MKKFVSRVSERLRNTEDSPMFVAPIVGAAAVAALLTPAGQEIVENVLTNAFVTDTTVYSPLTVERLMEGSQISAPGATQLEGSWQNDICQLPLISLGC